MVSNQVDLTKIHNDHRTEGFVLAGGQKLTAMSSQKMTSNDVLNSLGGKGSPESGLLKELSRQWTDGMRRKG